MPKISDQEFDSFVQYMIQQTGVVYPPSKKYLAESRLSPLLESFACRSFSDLFVKVKADRSGSLKADVVNALTINETSFFRDQSPFRLVAHKVIPDIIDRMQASCLPQRPIRAWSAACSTGQEAYSLAMTGAEILGPSGFEVIASDVSEDAVQRALMGEYSAFEVKRGVPPEKVNKYFLQKGENYSVRDCLRSIVKVRKSNLMEPCEHFGRFDIIFCRYVAIYFEPRVRQELFRRLVDRLHLGGVLVLGGGEVMKLEGDAVERLQHHNTVYYQLVK